MKKSDPTKDARLMSLTSIRISPAASGLQSPIDYLIMDFPPGIKGSKGASPPKLPGCRTGLRSGHLTPPRSS
jgi:hypothetical protein